MPLNAVFPSCIPNSLTRESSISSTSLHQRPSQALISCLSDHGAGGGGLVLPVRGHDADGTVVTGETVDTGLDENEAELGVLVLAVALKVLADGDGLCYGISRLKGLDIAYDRVALTFLINM